MTAPAGLLGMYGNSTSCARSDARPTDLLGRPRLSALTRKSPSPRPAQTPEIRQLQQLTEQNVRKLVDMESMLGSIESKLTQVGVESATAPRCKTTTSVVESTESWQSELERDLARLRGHLDAQMETFAGEMELMKADVRKAALDHSELKRLREGLQIFWGELDRTCCTRTESMREDLRGEFKKTVEEVSKHHHDREDFAAMRMRITDLEQHLCNIQKHVAASSAGDCTLSSQMTELAKTVEQQAGSLHRCETKLAAAVGRVDALEICISTSQNSHSSMIRDVASQHDSIPWTGQHEEGLPEHAAGHIVSTATNGVKEGGNDFREVTLEAREKRLEEAVTRLDNVFEELKRSKSNLMEDHVASADATLSTSLDGINAALSNCKGPANNMRLDFQHPTPATSEPVCQGSAWHALSKPMQVSDGPVSARWAFSRGASSVRVPSSRATVGVARAASVQHRDRERNAIIGAAPVNQGTRPQPMHDSPVE